MYRFLVVIEKADGNYSAYSPDLPGCIEKADGNYSAYSPDLPGCVATGSTHEEVEQNMYDAIVLYMKD
jgi:predicted RNase H-like HicB family nuclease